MLQIKIENDKADPTFSTLQKVAGALGVEMAELVGEGTLAAFDKQTLRRLQEIEQLPPEQREQLFFLIDAVIRDAKTQKAYAS